MIDDIGKRMNQLRLTKDISMAELAKKAGVTRSLLSQIEKGEAFPSLKTLNKIALVLDIPIKKFFETDTMPEPEEKIIVRSEKRSVIITQDKNLKQHILSPNTDDEIEFTIWEILPHKKSEPYFLYKHEGKEHFYVLSGELELKVQDNIFTIRENDSGCFNSGELHNYFNVTNKSAKIITAVNYRSYTYSQISDDDFLHSKKETDQ